MHSREGRWHGRAVNYAIVHEKIMYRLVRRTMQLTQACRTNFPLLPVPQAMAELGLSLEDFDGLLQDEDDTVRVCDSH